jgi:predicted double-glycine peptidase
MPLFVALSLLLSALASAPPASPPPAAEAGLRLDVPFIPQVKEGCGSAAIAMVMAWWKVHGHAATNPDAADVATIHKAVYSPKAKGTSAADMQRYFQRHGFRVYGFPGNWTDLNEHLAKGRPLIVALRPPGQRQLHYVVVSGLSETQVLVHDPALKPYGAISRAEFEEQWTASQHWTLLALPQP